jgi:hypothetical protein
MDRWHDHVHGHGFLLVVVNDLDVLRSSVRRVKADPPLAFHPDAVLPATVTGQLFQLVPGWSEQVRQVSVASSMASLRQATRWVGAI